MLNRYSIIMMIFSVLMFSACRKKATPKAAAVEDVVLKDSSIFKRYNKYIYINLTADLSRFNSGEKQMISLLIDAAMIMDDLYWEQTLGEKEDFIKYLDCVGDENLKIFGLANYGPWDRLDNNAPFINFCGLKPAGANFYPHDMTRQEFENFKDSAKTGPYSIIRRNENGSLKVIPYHEAYKDKLTKAAVLIKKAATLANDAGLKNYLNITADALLTDNYDNSDIAWLNMKNNNVDFIAGPIEDYEDALFGYKTAYEAYVLIKDKAWSTKLEKCARLLPGLQKTLPMPDQYKNELPGNNSDLNVYDIIYYAGDCNAGSKTIAVNLPNNPDIQLKYGTRRLQLKNAMRAKFDKILVPIANALIDPSQLKYISFNAFFDNTMFHEVVHGLGVKYTLKGKKVSDALKENYGTIEEGKADIVGLYIISELQNSGELSDTNILDHYVTFTASIFRSVRFGTSDAHGKANMLRFNYFLDNGAIVRNENGTYKIVPDKMKDAVKNLSQKILNLQSEGNYSAVNEWIEKECVIKPPLSNDLLILRNKGIPVDIIFNQGKEVLGLTP